MNFPNTLRHVRLPHSEVVKTIGLIDEEAIRAVLLNRCKQLRVRYGKTVPLLAYAPAIQRVSQLFTDDLDLQRCTQEIASSAVGPMKVRITNMQEVIRSALELGYGGEEQSDNAFVNRTILLGSNLLQKPEIESVEQVEISELYANIYNDLQSAEIDLEPQGSEEEECVEDCDDYFPLAQKLGSSTQVLTSRAAVVQAKLVEFKQQVEGKREFQECIEWLEQFDEVDRALLQGFVNLICIKAADAALEKIMVQQRLYHRSIRREALHCEYEDDTSSETGICITAEQYLLFELAKVLTN